MSEVCLIGQKVCVMKERAARGGTARAHLSCSMMKYTAKEERRVCVIAV